MVKIVKLWEGKPDDHDWFQETNMVDNAYKAYMKELDSTTGIKEYKFEQWLYKTYKVKWDTGNFYDKEELIFEDERLMAMFLLKFQK